MSGGREVFLIDKKRVEWRGDLGCPLVKKKGHRLVFLNERWPIENEN